jgi:hydrophobe/amphiphile efflux-3 (HAE3) family protein
MHFIQKFVEKPLVVILIIILSMAVGIFAIASNAKLETNLNNYMPSSHPAFAYSDEIEALFGIEEMILIAIEHPTTIFNESSLTKIRDITVDLPNQFSEIEEDSITSLYTADNIVGSDWGLEVESFYGDSIPSTAEELESLKEKVTSNEMVYGRNVSKDNTASLIIIKLNSGTDAKSFQKSLTAYLKEWEGPETIYVAGRPVVEGALAELGPADMARMFPIVMVVMIIVLLILLRSVRDTILNLVIVLIGTVSAFGSMALLKVPVYAVDTMIPVMLIAIGVAYGIHMHNAIHNAVLENPSIGKDELINKVLKAMIRPVFMAALTTAIGFISLMTSQVLPVRYFGLFSSIGVMVEMILALILFPISIKLLGIPKKRASKKIKEEKSLSLWQGKGSWGKFVLRKSSIIIVLSVIVATLGIVGTQKVWIDTSFLANFEDDSEIVKTDNFVNNKFGGTSSLNVIISADEPDAFKNPALLKAISKMQDDVLTNENVGSSFALTDFVKRMNKVMHDNKTEMAVIPDNQELVAQYLLLYEFSGDPKALESVIDYDYQTANVTFQLKSDSSAVMDQIISIVDQHKESLTALNTSVHYAGNGYKAFVFSELLLEGQIASLLLSFVIVAILLTLLFKNILVGIIGVIPIAITATINFGVMGLFNVPLSSATALISSIAVGIGVDYAIHLIEHYRNRRLEGYSIIKATFASIHNTGRAIIYNAFAVMGGFAVLIFSVFPPNRQVGTLIVLNMATSALGTLSILLVAIIALDAKGKFIKNARITKSENYSEQEAINI